MCKKKEIKGIFILIQKKIKYTKWAKAVQKTKIKRISNLNNNNKIKVRA